MPNISDRLPSMEGKYIEGTNKRYKIYPNGEVRSMWRWRWNNVIKQNVLIKPTSCHKVPHVILVFTTGKRALRQMLLVAKYFNIQPPDDYHHYMPYPIDDNLANCSIQNIGWKIVTVGTKSYEPLAYYDNKGNIVVKRCCVCGKKRAIKHFVLCKIGHLSTRRTYSNVCNLCVATRNTKYLEDHPDKKKSYDKVKIRWQKKKVAKAPPSYIAQLLKIRISDLTPNLIKLQTKRLCLSRKLRQVRQSQL